METKRGSTDGVAQLLTEDLLMPSQFADLHGASRELTNDQKLRLAVIEQALDDLRNTAKPKAYLVGEFSTSNTKGIERAQLIRQETIDWFESDETDPFSFNGLCAVLDLDPDHMRRGLRACNWNPAAIIREAVYPTVQLTTSKWSEDRREHRGSRRRKTGGAPKTFETQISTQELVHGALMGDAA